MTPIPTASQEPTSPRRAAHGVSDFGLDRKWTEALSNAPRWDPGCVETLVVVPHPDDEALSTGGLVALLRSRGATVRVLAVTDGERSHPGEIDPTELTNLRRAEQRAALDVLGVAPTSIDRVGLPDGEVAAHEQLLTDSIDALLHDSGVEFVIAPWLEDHHCDHEAAGRAAARAAAAHGVPIAFGLFWAFHRGRPPSTTGYRLVDLPLQRELVDRKGRAVRCHRSQIERDLSPNPIVSAIELALIDRSGEAYVVEERP